MALLQLHQKFLLAVHILSPFKSTYLYKSVLNSCRVFYQISKPDFDFYWLLDSYQCPVHCQKIRHKKEGITFKSTALLAHRSFFNTCIRLEIPSEEFNFDNYIESSQTDQDKFTDYIMSQLVDYFENFNDVNTTTIQDEIEDVEGL